jgi:hypothetical protein
MKNYPFGSISHGTMRNEDLYEAFLNALNGIDQSAYEHFKRTHEDDDDYLHENDIEENLEELFVTLHHYAAPYFYFGAHPGDGSDFGFWFSDDSLDLAAEEGYVLKVNTLSQIPAAADLDPLIEHVAVNHGNRLTLYDRNLKEIWSIT